MIYKPIPRKNGTYYMIGIPETATEEIDLKDKIILELQSIIEKQSGESPVCTNKTSV